MLGPDFLSIGDGSKRPLRPVQIEALTWLRENWHTSDVFVMRLDVASGKSLLAEAISRSTNAHILTPSNILIDQYASTYTQKNIVKGKSHYTCKQTKELSCSDWQSLAETSACAGCPYTEAKITAHESGSFFNPMSYWCFTDTELFKAPKVLVVDEAHGLANQMLQVCGVALKSTQYPFKDEYKDELRLGNWLKTQIDKLAAVRNMCKKDERSRRMQLTQEINQLSTTLFHLKDNSENYAIWTESVGTGRKAYKVLHIKPVTLPDKVSRQLLSCRKLILMSGTIFDTDVKDLIGSKPYLYKDFDAPIPAAQRPIYYRPVPFKLNWQTDPVLIANAIEDELKKHFKDGVLPNTIIHVAYSLSKKLKYLFRRPIIINSSEDKEAKLKQFIENGGVFLAGGCAEGLDLKDELCRLNIIPKLLYPDLNDPLVAKRKALEDGDEWYAMQVLKTLIQQIGRSTRHPKDFSTAVILDPNFSRMYSKYQAKLPKSFKSAIIWG